MPKYEVTFVDGKKVVKDAPDPGSAKERARADRRGQVPPDTPRSAPEVKIARVSQLDA
jgi:hypothetical protein